MTKELQYLRGVPELTRRGLACLVVDGPGKGEANRFRGTRLIAAAVALLSSRVGVATAEAAQLGVLIAVLAAVPLVTRTSDSRGGAQPPAAMAR